MRLLHEHGAGALATTALVLFTLGCVGFLGSLVLGCDCILRFLEAQELGLRTRVGEIMVANNVIGFATYGEQFNAMHVNQTFTGVALVCSQRRLRL